jgi:hypothetical protein
MQFVFTGFRSGDVLDYAPASGGENSGVFRGLTRAKTAPTGISYGLVFTTSPPDSSIDIFDSNFTGPYYLYGWAGAGRTFSGEYVTPSCSIYETCHGIRQPDKPFKNFYNAYYRHGFFESPWGANPTRTSVLSNFGTSRTLTQSDAGDAINFADAFQITVEEYHQLNGIVPINCGGGKSPENCNPLISPLQHFRYFYYECPSDIDANCPTYQEAEIKWVPGNGIEYAGPSGYPSYIFGGSLYNNSPIPTVLDLDGNFFMQDVCAVGGNINIYNNNLCPALVLETDTSILRGSNDLMATFVANAIAGFGFAGLGGNGKGGNVDGYGAGAQDLGNEDWWFWNFVYQENADTFPFDNSPDEGRVIGKPVTSNIVNSDGSVTVVTTQRTDGNNPTPQTFDSSIAWESWYWQHRLCADYPKYLPWTFGANIFASPETYFEVPYYSAIGKYGFYGVRFLESAGTLINPDGTVNSGCTTGDNANPFDNATVGLGGPEIYNRLLKTSALQRKYSDYYAGNQGLFLALNYDFLTGDAGYNRLQNFTKSGIKVLHDKFWIECKYSQMGEPYLLTAWINDIPTLYNDNGYLEINPNGSVTDPINNVTHTGYYRSGVPDSYLYTNNLFESVFFNQGDLPAFDAGFIGKYGNYIVRDTQGSLNTGSYNFMANVQRNLSHKRNLGNESYGTPVDLYPMGRIYYGMDDPSGYYNAFWLVAPNSKSKPPQIPRRYFEGYYASNSGVFPNLSALQTYTPVGEPLGFNAGFYNKIGNGKMHPKRGYVPVASGNGLTNNNTHVHLDYTGVLQVLGYHQIGVLDPSFSCFNPIFVQQPNDIICKVGQTPTFRSLAVDYHTLPEDKVQDGRWPEINYWADRLKLTDDNGKIISKLSYKWGRFPTGLYANYNLGNLSGVEWSNPTGEWCNLEGDGSNNCTVIHPNECVPKLTGYRTSITPGLPNQFAEFVKGAKVGIDDQYYYFCVVSGIFGERRSEPARLIIDDTLILDVAVKNGSSQGWPSKLVFTSMDGSGNQKNIALSSYTGPYYGYTPNTDAIPETAFAERRTPSAVGCLPSWSPCCDDNKKRTMGMIGYDTWNFTWQPPAIQDLPLLNTNWGQVVPYGALVTFSKILTQEEGDAMYGRTALPKVSEGQFLGDYFGIPFDLYLNGGTKVKHWSVEEPAWATDNTKQGIPFNAGDIVSALYPASEGAKKWSAFPTKSASQNYGKGQWQFSNNLGLIKRLGYTDLVGKDDTWDGKDSRGETLITFSNILTDKNKLLDNIRTSLKSYPGGNAGWRKSSLGRHMAYFVEGFSSFYIFCGNKKKEFVTNWSYIAPGLRVGNAGFQYSWVGQPNSSYLTRQTMPGPYSFFWKMNRHNRDKNGNGMPLGMYAYSTDGPYTMMYDLPAVYGLYIRNFDRVSKNDALFEEIRSIRTDAAGGQPNYINAGAAVWTQKFEFNQTTNDDGTISWCGVPFGTWRNRCSGLAPADGTDARYCQYPNDAIAVAGSQDLDIYECPTLGVKANVCFPPCLSLRYDQGILPGGKSLDLFGNLSSKYGPDKIVSDARYNGLDATRVLGPAQTPWAQAVEGFLAPDLLPKLAEYQSIDPCHGGGSDHCNYVTPTAWIGSTQKAYSNMNYMSDLINGF